MARDPARTRELFERALPLAEGDRGAFLAEVCADDEELRRDVEELLFADARDDGFLDRGAVLAGTPDALIGQQLGNYRVERVLGRGGMSVVFEATQREPRRRVALKVLSGPFLSAERAARFRLEAELLARLDHPAIARIYEAGSATIGGQPVQYLALELVRDALSITEYARRRGLDRRARVRLLGEVCAAVAAGHRQGVVHRDLKPTNVLVDPRGRPHVIDFGIARAVGAESLGGTLTATGEVVGTPRYMSPEQHDGRRDAVDARTDVWSLGLLLFELLTGAHPFEVDDLSPTGIARVVCDEEPARLSRFDPRLRGDLEIIVTRALARDPAERYGSVEALGRELERHLAGEPIEARADHALYVLRRRARRHRRLLAAAGVVLTVTVVAAVGLGLLWNEAARARDTSERSLYRNQIAVAANALAAGRIAEMKRVLEDCNPGQRGWEWGHLVARSDDSVWTARHGDESVTAVAASPDGERVASGDAAGRVRLWDATSGAPLGDLVGHESFVAAVAFDPSDGRRLLSVSRDRTVREWDLEGLHEVSRIVRPEEVWSIALSPDGAWFAIGTHAGTVEVGRRGKGDVKWSSRGHRYGVECLAISPDGRLLASGGRDGTLALWDSATGAEIRRIDRSTLRAQSTEGDVPAHGNSVTGVAFDPTGGALFSSSADGVGKMWAVATGELLHFTYFPRPLGPIVVSPTGDRIALPCGATVELTNTEDAAPGEPLRGHTLSVSEAAFSPDGSHLYSASRDGCVKAYDLDARGGALAFGRHESGTLFRIAVSRDRRRLASGDEVGWVTVWDTRNLEPLTSFRAHEARVRGIALDADGGRVWTTADDRTVRAFDATSGERLATAEAPGRAHVLWTEHGLVLGGENDRIQLLGSEDLAPQAELVCEAHCTALAASADGRLVASGGRDGVVHLLRSADLVPVAAWDAHEEKVWRTCFVAPDVLATGGGDRAVRLWRIPGGELLGEHALAEPPTGIEPVPGGGRLLLLPMRGDPRVVALETGETLLELSGHPADPIRRELVSLEDGRFVTGDSSGVLYVWSDTSGVRR